MTTSGQVLGPTVYATSEEKNGTPESLPSYRAWGPDLSTGDEGISEIFKLPCGPAILPMFFQEVHFFSRVRRSLLCDFKYEAFVFVCCPAP